MEGRDADLAAACSLVLDPDLPHGLLVGVVAGRLVDRRHQVRPQLWVYLRRFQLWVLFAEWHLDVKALLSVLHRERLEIEGGTLLLLEVLGALVSANHCLLAARRHRAILADEALIIM